MIYDNDMKQLAYYLVRALEGDELSRTVSDEAWALLRKYNFVDIDHSWKEDDDLLSL